MMIFHYITSMCCCCSYVASVLSDSVRSHRRQPTRLPLPWDSPGKNAGVGCHFLLQCMKVKSEIEVAQLCPTLSDPMDGSLPGSSVHWIFQARVPQVAQWYRICLPMQEKQETWVRFLGQEDPLEKGMVTHSSIFAWRTPWTEEPDGLRSMGSIKSHMTKRLSTHAHHQIQSH